MSYCINNTKDSVYLYTQLQYIMIIYNEWNCKVILCYRTYHQSLKYYIIDDTNGCNEFHYKNKYCFICSIFSTIVISFRFTVTRRFIYSVTYGTVFLLLLPLISFFLESLRSFLCCPFFCSFAVFFYLQVVSFF